MPNGQTKDGHVKRAEMYTVAAAIASGVITINIWFFNKAIEGIDVSRAEQREDMRENWKAANERIDRNREYFVDKINDDTDEIHTRLNSWVPLLFEAAQEPPITEE